MPRHFLTALPLFVASTGVLAALPPGYEDVMWCPPDYCRRYVPNEPGMAGPVSMFNECYNPATDDVVDGVWTGELTDVAAPEGWTEDPADCPAEVEEPTEPEEGQFDDIIAACGAQIGAGVACFTTSEEPACEDFDPMSLLAGELPVPDSCDEGAELVCGVLVGCCDQQIVDIAMCAAETNLGLVCDTIDCCTVTSGGGGRVMTYAYLLGVGLALVGWNL